MRRSSLCLLPFFIGCAASQSPPQTAPPLAPAATPSAVSDSVVIVQSRLFADDKPLTPEFAAIDSFDVSRTRREVVFSAKRDKSFDIGLVSLDGSEIHWLPEDPADEVNVKWAPVGHKVSYVIRRAGGDFVRTVHIPTAMQQLADFPYAAVKSLVWEANGERYSVTLTAPDASEQVVSLKYDGTARKVVSPPKTKLDVSVEPFASGVLMRPSLVRYGERLPLVVWQSDTPLEWNDARGSLMRESRVAMAVVQQVPDALPDEAWLDRDRVFVVCGPASAAHCADRLKSALTHVIVVPIGDVESIRQQLKDPNGRR